MVRRALNITLVLACVLLSCAQSARQLSPALMSLPGAELYLLRRDATLSELSCSLYGDSSMASILGSINGLTSDSLLRRGDRLVVAADASRLRQYLSQGESAGLRLREVLLAYDRGTFLAQEGRHQEALPYLEQAAVSAPGMAEARYNLGVSRLAMEDYAAAEEALEAAVTLRPSRPGYHYALALAYLRSGNDPDARRALEAALELDPGFLEARFALARLLEATGDLRRARGEWRRYLEDDQQSPWAEEARRRLKDLEQ